MPNATQIIDGFRSAVESAQISALNGANIKRLAVLNIIVAVLSARKLSLVQKRGWKGRRRSISCFKYKETRADKSRLRRAQRQRPLISL